MKYTAAHWGIYEVHGNGDENVVRPFSGDPDPSPIGLHQFAAELKAMRIGRPSMRKSVFDNGPGSHPELRGIDPFVEVDWETATSFVAAEIVRVRSQFGNGAIFGGSYGWASAGRFHHAQSQVHRFLNVCGGYVSHRDSYSLGAGRVLLPHIVDDFHKLMFSHSSWDVLAKNTELFIAFGGVPAKNAQIAQGLVGRHRIPEGLRDMAKAGTRIVNISPVGDNLDADAEIDWMPIRPGTDTALMLGLAFHIHHLGRHDTAFLSSHCTGWDQFEAYLTGVGDGVAKTPQWASGICGIPASRIVALAQLMTEKRTMINVAWSLQRADYGEQPFWMTVVLACMLGQIGLAGGGFGLGYGATNLLGSDQAGLSAASLPQGRNQVTDFIPVARLADMLLKPGEAYTYNGEDRLYPDIRFVYWAGGNPFHHHQDLSRLTTAWQRPETIVVNEQFWTASARRADLVLPVTTTAEREDIGYARREGVYLYMSQIEPPFADSLDDFEIFRRIASKLECEDAFTEGRGNIGWLEYLHEQTRQAWADHNMALPDFDSFRQKGLIDLADMAAPQIMLADFRNDPVANPLPTPSGRIEIFSQRLAGFGNDDCPGHPTWFPPREWAHADLYPFHLISDQPVRRLHSQLDPSPWSQAAKVCGREPVFMHPDDAKACGVFDGDIVELHNGRGACLAGVRLSEQIMRGVVRLSTGAWYDPEPQTGIERHGNPNAVTPDRGASKLSQGCTAQSCRVAVRRPTQPLTAVGAFLLPEFVAADGPQKHHIPSI